MNFDVVFDGTVVVEFSDDDGKVKTVNIHPEIVMNLVGEWVNEALSQKCDEMERGCEGKTCECTCRKK